MSSSNILGVLFIMIIFSWASSEPQKRVNRILIPSEVQSTTSSWSKKEIIVDDLQNEETQQHDTTHSVQKAVARDNDVDKTKHFKKKIKQKKGHKSAKFAEKLGHKKGHTTKGFHNTFHKDEYHKEHKLYDDPRKRGSKTPRDSQ